jgi:hypothetical protein
VEVDAVVMAAPVGQVAADHPTLQRSGEPVSLADSDVTHPV